MATFHRCTICGAEAWWEKNWRAYDATQEETIDRFLRLTIERTYACPNHEADLAARLLRIESA